MILSILFALFTFVPFLLTALSLVFGKKKNTEIGKSDANSYALVITCYKDWSASTYLVKSLLALQKIDFHIYLIADNCEDKLYPEHDEKLSVLFPPNPLNSKLKSIYFGIQHFIKPHSHIVIFDPDNLVRPDFLEKIDVYHQLGYKVVQGKRVAKNLDSRIACLDSFSESYYNYAHKKLPFLLGSSATIAGSGMSLETPIYQTFIEDSLQKHQDKVIIAEDKMLQVELVKSGVTIAFAEEALIYDEKVSTGAQASKQRTRWIASYFQFVSQGLLLFVESCKKKNWNGILFSYIITTPPLFIIGFFYLFLSLLGLIFNPALFWTTQSLLFFFFANMIWSVWLSKAPLKVIVSIFFAPLFVFYQLKALFKLKETKNSFLTTQNSKNISIEDILKNEN